ncbi:hypothetical protein ACW7G0_13800 [Lysobacter sp. A286]
MELNDRIAELSASSMPEADDGYIITGDPAMLRKLILPLSAMALLGGCMTGGYGYQQARGDYYYGQPSTDYRYYNRYGNDGYYSNRYPGYYGNAYYGNAYYGNSYNRRYPYGYYRPPVIVVRPGHNNNHGNNGNHTPRPDTDRDRAPWRDYERLQRERIQRSERPTGSPAAVQRSVIAAPVRPTSTRPSSGSSNNRGSRMETMIRKSKAGRDNSQPIRQK